MTLYVSGFAKSYAPHLSNLYDLDNSGHWYWFVSLHHRTYLTSRESVWLALCASAHWADQMTQTGTATAVWGRLEQRNKISSAGSRCLQNRVNFVCKVYHRHRKCVCLRPKVVLFDMAGNTVPPGLLETCLSTPKSGAFRHGWRYSTARLTRNVFVYAQKWCFSTWLAIQYCLAY